MVTVLTDTAVTDIGGHVDGDALWLSPAELLSATGWERKLEGACRGDVCVPLPVTLVRADGVDAAGFWRHTGRPVLYNERQSVWLLAEGAMQRRTTLESLQAPDFTLPDLQGTQHSLSDYHGKKVFLATWASW
jgi:hypothetical protein